MYGAARVDSAAEIHAAARLASGFTIDQLMAEYRVLRARVLRLRRFEKQSDNQLELDTMIRFNEAVDQALSESVARYSLKIRESQNLFFGHHRARCAAPLRYARHPSRSRVR